MSAIQAALREIACRVKEQKPLAASITNTVTVNLVANAQLAAGGTAAMVYMPDEGEALAAAADAMYINMGTILPVYEEALPRTVRTLWENKKPWVIDPVGIGIGALRREILQEFKRYRPSVIRGNASEIIALANLWELESGQAIAGVRGVDATDRVESAQEAALSLARWTGGAVSVSGEVDLVTDGQRTAKVAGGSKFFPCITGAGCSLGGVTAVYAAVGSPFVAALAATILYDLAGRRAEAKAGGPASFQMQFLDELYSVSPEDLAAYPLTWEESRE